MATTRPVDPRLLDRTDPNARPPAPAEVVVADVVAEQRPPAV